MDLQRINAEPFKQSAEAIHFDDELELQRRMVLKLMDTETAHKQFQPPLLQGERMQEMIKEELGHEKTKLF